MNAKVPVSSTAVPGASENEAQSSGTAEMCAAVRSVEHMRPAGDRLLDDPYAHHFIQNPLYRFLFARSVTAMPAARLYNSLFEGWAAEIILRYRHSDELMKRAVDGGCRQVVILGAGYDSTALRCAFDADVVFYEVDKPDTQENKLEIMRRKQLRPRSRVEYIGCDFAAGDDVVERLTSRGFDPAEPSFVSWLGVSYYLPRSAVRDTLEKLSRACAPGSRVIFDYVVPGVIDGTIDHTGAQRGRRFAAKRGEPFSFGIGRDELDAFLPDESFRVVENFTVPDLVELYGDPKSFWLSVADFIGTIVLERE
ncbi:SAM-dependent methyltransferase [Streptomyces sp. TS71-3]|uniref:class I SAM-dependent methyltransferase n=1 Tax=Streptomyces sp. TS71-3 TaxID=2733862 RepID=UPI001AFE2605|nr:SAM-dependent methyltransferase [Streptomyces sp. TS71-3]GHJ36840.1 S-adenosyl-L-methionine-dependent methyltransferase [Streptomyces sp. TS71-3]